MENEKREHGNFIRIAGRPFEVYILNMLELFQTNDQIEIQVTDPYIEKANKIIDMWRCIGVVPLREYPRFEVTRENLIAGFNRDKKKFVGNVNRCILTKLPDLFMYTIHHGN